MARNTTDRFRNKLNWSSYVVTIIGVCLILAFGCESSQETVKTDQETEPKAAKTDNQTDIDAAQSDSTQTESGAKTDKPNEPEWFGETVALIGGKSLDGWETIEFGGEGDTTIADGVLAFDAGDPFTGISSTNENLPKTNYEIALEARKMDGIDFFCGLTFPVADSHCTLIVGGWGGATVGLSCINEKDASNNETCTYMKFESEQWYKIRVRVEPEKISVWIDDEQLVDQNIVGKKISLRGDTELMKPMGICSFMTAAEYKNMRLRQFKAAQKSVDTDAENSASKSGAIDKK